jgi:hypothetical protein
VPQRGNARRFILDCDADRRIYLDLLRHSVRLYGMELTRDVGFEKISELYNPAV